MDAVERYNEYKEYDFDEVVYNISRGRIKSGRYAHLVKIDKNKIIKEKELFKDGKNDKS